MKKAPPVPRRNFLKQIAGGSAGLALAPSLFAATPDQSSSPLPESDAANPNTTSLVVMSPPSAQTADSIAILWNKPANVSVESYDVYLGSDLVTTTKFTDYMFQGLGAGTKYEISVRVNVKEAAPLHSNTLAIATKSQPQIVDITKHGAVAGGATLNTPAIQAAIDACSAGGVVHIPAGTFLTGAIFLKSDITLHLEKDAILLGSPDPKDYPVMKYRSEGNEKPCYASLINTRDIQGSRWRNIAITGSGTIDGSGVALRRNELKEKAAERGCLICIRDTDGLYLQGVTIQQAPFWCVHPIYCSGVTINGVSIFTKYPGIVNGDGIDPDSCRDVFIFNSHIASEDDCIALKSGRDAEGRAVGIPTENVRISHCLFTSGFGVAMGSEMAGGLRNVLVEDCVFKDAFSIASVKAPRGRGSFIEIVTYRDCTLTNQNQAIKDSRWFRGALYVDQYYGIAEPDLNETRPRDESTPFIRNVLFQNITIDTVGGNAIYLAGLPESPLENIRLENVTAIGVHGFTAYNVRALTLDNVSVEARDGHALHFVNVK
jgi:exo-poly-alpha-galacturonosidase